MSRRRRYALTFPGTPGGHAPQDVVVVADTGSSGPGGYPVYADASGIVRAEISDLGEVRMLASGGHQSPQTPVHAEPLPSEQQAEPVATEPVPTDRHPTAE